MNSDRRHRMEQAMNNAPAAADKLAASSIGLILLFAVEYAAEMYPDAVLQLGVTASKEKGKRRGGDTKRFLRFRKRNF